MLQMHKMKISKLKFNLLYYQKLKQVQKKKKKEKKNEN